MDKIISDIDVLYNFFLEELHNRNINLRSDVSTDPADLALDISINQPKIKKWLSSLNVTQKAEIVKLIKSTSSTFKSRKKRYRKSTKSWLQFKQASRILSIIVVIIGLGFYSIFAFTATGGTRLTFEHSRVMIITVFTVTISLAIIVSRIFTNQIKATKRKLHKIDALSAKVSTALTNIATNNVNNLDITTDTFALSVINFMSEYKKEVSKDKFGDFIKYTLLNEISFYFSEQDNILYRNITSIATINNTDLIDFVDYMFSEQLILDDITKINENITKYAIPNTDIIKNQDELVKTYMHELNNKIANSELLKENNISIIFKNKLKYLIKYKEFTQDQILRQIKIKTTNPSDKIVNSNDVYKNYKILIEQLFTMIDQDNKHDTYLDSKIDVPSRFNSLTNFSNIYNNLSIDHLINIKDTTITTISKINSYINLYQYDLEKTFDDNATINQRFVVLAVAVILISGINIPNIVNILSGHNYTNAEKEEKKDLFTWKLLSSRDAIKTFWTDNVEVGINYTIVISLWAVLCVTAIFYCINTQSSGKSNLSKNKANTSLLVDRLNDVQSNIDKLITLKKYTLEKTDILSKKIQDDKILDNLGYKYAVNPENTNEITNIIKYDIDDSIYNVYTFEQIKEQLTLIIYHDFVNIMIVYEEPNFVKMKKFDEPFPITDLMVNIVFFAISVGVLIMLYLFLNPINLFKDLQNLADCELDVDKKIELIEGKIVNLRKVDELNNNNEKLQSFRKEIAELEQQIINIRSENISNDEKTRKLNNIDIVKRKIKNKYDILDESNKKLIKLVQNNQIAIKALNDLLNKLSVYNNTVTPIINKQTELESKIKDESDSANKTLLENQLTKVKEELKAVQENKDNHNMFSDGCRTTLVNYDINGYSLKLKIFTALSIVYVSVYYIAKTVSSTNF